MVKIIRETKKYGDSLFVRLGYDIMQILNLDKQGGEILEVDVERVKKFDESERYVVHCETPIIINSHTDVVDCPICGKEINISAMEVKFLK